tara:strand:- start:883 stop:1914 length:1032 start_codon:yes stop_codon:yes gene_type:complete
MSSISTFSRSGQDDGAGGSFDADNKLFLKVFSGEILTTFEENNVMKGLHTVRTISSGKSAQFPTTGVATAKYHTAGQDIISESGYISEVKHGEKTINIDDVLISSTFLANIDELKNHYDVRSIYAKELGKALAKRFDIATMKVLLAAGNNTTPAYTDGPTTAAITPTSAVGSGKDAIMTAAELIDALYAAAQSLDESDVPSEGRFALLQPQDYYNLITADTNAISAVNRDIGGVGSIASGTVSQVAGISLVKTNHIKDVTVATQGETDDAGANNTTGSSGYNDDYSGSRFVVAHPSAIGTVKLLDLATESEYQIQRQGHLFVAKYAMGHGILRPECAVAVNPS